MANKVATAVDSFLRDLEKWYPTFRIFVWFREHGISREIQYQLFKQKKKEVQYLQNHPTEDMVEARNYFSNNMERVNSILEVLSDDASRKIYKDVINYRTNRIPIPKGSYSLSDQYFSPDIIDIDDDEIFVDCGAFLGDTIQHFLNKVKASGKRFQKIVAFEPNKENSIILEKFFGKKDCITIVNKGTSYKDGFLTFFGKGPRFHAKEYAGGGSLSSERYNKGETIAVTSIDSVPECRDATWIKMDVEGAELDSLYGAQNTILKNKPKLTICLYHSNEDMLSIIEFIHTLIPEYKIYIRHHTRTAGETVMYAMI